jgi:hypothetical protein
MSAVFNDKGERGIRILRHWADPVLIGYEPTDMWVAMDDVVYLLDRDRDAQKTKIEELVLALHQKAEYSANCWIEIGRGDLAEVSIAKIEAYAAVLVAVRGESK